MPDESPHPPEPREEDLMPLDTIPDGQEVDAAHLAAIEHPTTVEEATP